MSSEKENKIDINDYIITDTFNPLFRNTNGKRNWVQLREIIQLSEKVLSREMLYAFIEDTLSDFEELGIEDEFEEDELSEFDNYIFAEQIKTKEGLLNYLGVGSEEEFLESIEADIGDCWE